MNHPFDKLGKMFLETGDYINVIYESNNTSSFFYYCLKINYAIKYNKKIIFITNNEDQKISLCLNKYYYKKEDFRFINFSNFLKMQNYDFFKENIDSEKVIVLLDKEAVTGNSKLSMNMANNFCMKLKQMEVIGIVLDSQENNQIRQVSHNNIITATEEICKILINRIARNDGFHDQSQIGITSFNFQGILYTHTF